LKSITLSFACVALSLVTACQSTGKPPVTENMEVNQQTQYFVEAKILLDKLKLALNQGREDQLSYFAPNTFKQAIAEFDNATEEYMDIGRNGASSLNFFQSDTEQYKEAKQEIINYIALANQKLQFAYSIKNTAESTLAKTFTQKELLKKLGAPTVYTIDYKKINAKIDNLVEFIDDGKVSQAQEKEPELLAEMQALEVRTVRNNALSQLDSNIAHIKKNHLAKYTPISFQQLLAARNNANTIITSTPRASTKIKTAVKLAEFELAHLYHITKEVHTLQQTDNKYYEEYLLAKETLLHTVSESLKTDDVRDLSLIKQVKSIALQAGTIKRKLSTAKSTVLALQSDKTQSSAATENLRAEFQSQLVNLNEKYDTLFIENAELNKEIQSKSTALIRLQAYKEAVTQIESKHAAERAFALKAQAKREAEQKALALKEQAEKEALALARKEVEKQALALKEKIDKEALALEAKVKKETEQKAIALQTQSTVAVTQTVEPIKEAATKQEPIVDVVEVEVDAVKIQDIVPSVQNSVLN